MQTQCIEKATFRVVDLGLVEYREAYKIQKENVRRVIEGDTPALIFCEHPAVLTMGRLADERYILTPREVLAQKGIDVVSVDRGGEVTLHNPGQLVVYPIIDLNCRGKSLKQYMSSLQEIAVKLLREFDIFAHGQEGERGVWVDDKKIVSIGVGVKRWVTYHGLGINVHNDLNLYSLIKPCGLNVEMTSVENVLNASVDLKAIKEATIMHFNKCFGGVDNG